jgi:alginate O-acetyltransferase complex protein AlgI
VTFLEILLVAGIFLLAGLLLKGRWSEIFILSASVIGIYWFQPGSPIRHLEFWFPTASIIITTLVWFITQKQPIDNKKNNLITGVVVCVIILFLSLSRYTDLFTFLTASKPPSPVDVLRAIAIALICILLIQFIPLKRVTTYLLILIIVGLFILLKSTPLTIEMSRIFRSFSGQDIKLAGVIDIQWLGFSYLSFRLIHVLLDSQENRSPETSLAQFISFALFLPAFISGPIDRIQRFKNEFMLSQQNSKPILQHKPEFFVKGGCKIFTGIFKKFILADSLALFALSSQNANQVTSSFWMWILVYAYSLRIYFDFSGYTDIAIGSGMLLGINLPANFDRPYLKENLTSFWNSWHMTLAQWFRAYLFNPLTRKLRTLQPVIPTWLIILIGQTITMVLIGLWHGITYNFAIWGLWHAAGLFIHNRWTNWMRGKYSKPGSIKFQKMLSVANWFMTFNFISLGWVWFALSEPNSSWHVFRVLFSVR